MSGILVGVDGSGHSQRALEWAMKEAAIRHTSLNVLTVHEAVRGFYSGTAVYADDPTRTEKARRGGPGRNRQGAGGAGRSPPGVGHGQGGSRLPGRRAISAGEDADMIVLGSRGAGGLTRLLMGSTAGKVAQHAPFPVLMGSGVA